MNGPTPKPLKASALNDWLNNNADLTVVDVREQQELAIAPFPHPVKHLPLSAAEKWMGSIDDVLPNGGSIVVLCHAGVRSQHFGLWLLEQKTHGEVWNLEGGIDAWSMQVDSQVPRY